MVLDGCSIGNYSDLVKKVVHKEAAGDNSGISSRETDIQTLYRRRADGGFQ